MHWKKGFFSKLRKGEEVEESHYFHFIAFIGDAANGSPPTKPDNWNPINSGEPSMPTLKKVIESESSLPRYI